MRQLLSETVRRVRFVLVATQHSGNTGSAARALKTMGFGQLVLVNPAWLPDETSHAMAAGAEDVLDAARICGSLEEAVSDCRWVIGTTARSRRIGLEELTPRQASQRARSLLAQNDDAEIAIVFGRERTGLTNDELQLCNAGLMIDANPEYSSLNLAAAVQVIAYELRTQFTDEETENTDGVTLQWQPEKAATHGQLEGFFGQTAKILESIDFHKGREERSALFKLRRLFMRWPMDEKELRMLRGILHDMERALRIQGND